MALAQLGEGWLTRIERCLDGVGTPTDVDTRRLIARMLDRVVEWNQKLDLTAARDPDELVDLFLADAAVVARRHGARDETWVDVGSGAGAPGLPLALLAHVPITLVEPKGKRVAFLRTLVGALALDGVRVERARSALLASQSFDVAISRATLEPPEWVREGTRLARRAVWLLLATADAPVAEGWRIDRDERYALPLTGAARRAVRYVRA